MKWFMYGSMACISFFIFQFVGWHLQIFHLLFRGGVVCVHGVCMGQREKWASSECGPLAFRMFFFGEGILHGSDNALVLVGVFV